MPKIPIGPDQRSSSVWLTSIECSPLTTVNGWCVWRAQGWRNCNNSLTNISPTANRIPPWAVPF